MHEEVDPASGRARFVERASGAREKRLRLVGAHHPGPLNKRAALGTWSALYNHQTHPSSENNTGGY